MDETEFRQGIRDRDPEAWNHLAALFQSTLERQASLFLPSRMDPSNAVGEVWLRALEAASSYDPQRHPFPWLSRICATTCFNQRRGLARAFARGARRALEDFYVEKPETGEASAELEAVLRHLPRREQVVVKLRFLFELPIDEIASLLSRKPSSVRSTLIRGISRLRTQAAQGTLEAWILGVGEPGDLL